jgi:hypothetical protein
MNRTRLRQIERLSGKNFDSIVSMLLHEWRILLF